MIIKDCKRYQVRMDGFQLLRMRDSKSVFKIYFLSIQGREKPELYDWKQSLQTCDAFINTFLAKSFEGIGFVTSFPHITKVFRFSPYVETVLDVSEFQTVDLIAKNCSRGDGTHEFACLAEAHIAAKEFEFWAESDSVQKYLEFRCEPVPYAILKNTKLSEYWQRI